MFESDLFVRATSLPLFGHRYCTNLSLHPPSPRPRSCQTDLHHHHLTRGCVFYLRG